jgi:hypothetical protein
MPSDHDLLQQIRIASPCSAAWDEMQGDDRVRFCGHCQLNVYNLSAMSPQEAAAFVREKEGRLCVRFFAREDGTMLTEDCPVGFRAIRRRLLARVGLITSGYTALTSTALLFTAEGRSFIRGSWLAQFEPFKTLAEWLYPAPPAPPEVGVRQPSPIMPARPEPRMMMGVLPIPMRSIPKEPAASPPRAGGQKRSQRRTRRDFLRH